MMGIMNECNVVSEKRIKGLTIVFLFITLFLILRLGDLMTHFLYFFDTNVAR